LSGIGLSLMGALLAGVNSLLRAASLPLLALADAQAWQQAQARWLRRQAWEAAAGALDALAAHLFGNTLLEGLGLMS
ncbi:hypothetical protein, partial [Pseudomonas syringae group genomosp. 7]|uniref:hypothetical protein n=1 Tax=Pseudomonas syringae group genomosp. 7 TaxID=251699 RepID=UPI00376F59DD